MNKRIKLNNGNNIPKNYDIDLIDAFIEETTTTTDYILSKDPKDEDIDGFFDKIQKLEKEFEKSLEKIRKRRKILNYNKFVNVGSLVFLGGDPGIKTILDILDYLDIKSIFNLDQTGFFCILYKKFSIDEMEKIKIKYIDKITQFINSLRVASNIRNGLPDCYHFIPNIFRRNKFKYDITTKKILIKYLYLNNKLHYLDLPWDNINLDYRDKCISAKGYIFMFNDLDIIKHLTNKYKVKFGICDGQGNTCINTAIYNKYYDTIKYLFKTNLNCVENLLSKNKYGLHILHYALIRDIDNETFNKLLRIILKKNKSFLCNQDILRIKIRGYRVSWGTQMTILDYSELKSFHEFPDYFNPNRQNYDDNKIKTLKEYGAVRNPYRSVETNDIRSLKYWINNIQKEKFSDMYNNYNLSEAIMKNDINYSYLKYDGNACRRWTSNINPLDLSYILGKNDCLTFLMKNGIKINISGLLHIIKELKNIDLVKFWLDKCKFNLEGILTLIYNFDIIDSEIEKIIKFLKGKNATLCDEHKYNFAFRAVLNEDLNRLKELLDDEYGHINDLKIDCTQKYIKKLLLKRTNLLHFAILYNQKNIEIIEYLSLFNNSCLLRKYKKSNKTTLGINQLIKMRSSKPKYHNNKYKEFTNKIYEFYNGSNSFLNKKEKYYQSVLL